MGSKYSNNTKKAEKKRFFKFRWLIYLGVFGLILMGIAYLVFGIMSKPYRERAEEFDLSKIDDVEVKSLILDRKGREIGRIFVENRDKINVKDIPQTMVQALVSGEDQRFYSHDGVDRKGVLRAVYLNFKAGRQTQGASTLTQQLARNAFHLKEDADKRGEGGMKRKAVEAYLAMRIERHYSKSEILGFYLNRIPFGSGYYGIRSAALGYFGKEPRDLSVSECCSLVGCIKNPTRISPLNSLEENKKARNQVLKRMMAEGFLSESEGKPLMDKDVVVNPKPIRRGTSHLYERVARSVRKVLGEEALTEGGFKIYTTIDLDIQRSMEKGLSDQLTKVESKEGYKNPKYASYRRANGKPNYLQGAGLMLDNSNGAVIAYVGGRDFTHSQYDFVRSGQKPLGTAFLPFVYTTALERKMSLADRVLDGPMDNRSVMVDGREGILGEWGMELLAPSYEGEVSLRRALETSKIAASVRLGKKLGVSSITETAKRFKVANDSVKSLPRVIVGTSDASLPNVVKAYTAFANAGNMVEDMYFIDRIVDSKGKSRYVSSKSSSKRSKVMSKESAYILHTALKGALRKGTHLNEEEAASLGAEWAGKTGTTFDFEDNWFVGYNGNVTCGMWMGFLSGSRDSIYPGAFSRETLLPAWYEVMATVDKVVAPKEIKMPDSVVRIEVCEKSGLRKTRYCEDYTRDAVTGVESYRVTTHDEFFMKGNTPDGYCDFHGIKDDSLVSEDVDSLSVSHSIPVQPKEPLLLGDDPYGSIQPDFAPRDKTFRRRIRNYMSFDELEAEDKAAAIILRRPKRVSIYEE